MKNKNIDNNFLEASIESFKRLITALKEYKKINEQKKNKNNEENETDYLIKAKLKLFENLLDSYEESKLNKNKNDAILSSVDKLAIPELFFSMHELQKLNILNLIFRGKYRYGRYAFCTEKV
jgi:hypothetical protein